MSQSLLFVHQTPSQQQLLHRYGNYLTLMDATYKTTKYDLPLFMLAVKTNIDNQVVGTFIVHCEKRENILEALRVMKSWNTEWNPQNFMTDNCVAEIKAVQGAFPGKPKADKTYIQDLCQLPCPTFWDHKIDFHQIN